MKLKFISLIIMVLLNSGCIFSGDERTEKHIVDGYYLNYAGVSYNLIYKQNDASTQKLIVPTSIDSIGWDEYFIFGVTNNKYFVVDCKSQNIKSELASRVDFIKECERLGIINKDLRTSSSL